MCHCVPCCRAGVVNSVRLFLTLRVPVKAGGAQVLLFMAMAGKCHTLQMSRGVSVHVNRSHKAVVGC